MALKLGELVTILKTDNKALKDGLVEGRREVRAGGQDMAREAESVAKAMSRILGTGGRDGGMAWARGAGGRLRDSIGEFVTTGANLAGKIGQGLASKLPGAVGGVISGLPPQVQGAVVVAAAAIAVTLSAVIGAALAAGILLAVGGGVLALGIKQAIKDPKVAAAWSGFGDRAKKALSGFAEPFKGPLIRAAKTFGDAIERMAPTLKTIGEMVAPIIDQLAPALAGFAEMAMPGLQEAIEKSLPLFETLADHIPKIGIAVSSFLSSVAGGSEGASTFLDHFLTMLEGAIISAGVLIGGLARLYQWTVDTFSTLAKTTGAVWDSIKSGATAAKEWVVGKFNSVVGFVGGLPGRISSAASGMWNGLKNSFRGALNAMIRWWNNLSFDIRIPHNKLADLAGVGGAGFTVNTPNLPQLARGGTALAPGLAIVGDAGPELVHLGRGATVQPLSGAGGGGGLIGVLRLIVATPDGRRIKDELIDAASLRGQSVGRYLGVAGA